jgi:hypothetical protein
VSTKKQRAASYSPEPYENGRERAWKKYGLDLTIAQYNKMLIEQEGRCSICGGNRAKRKLAVDHDHKTGKIRGLICGVCNTLLGMADDDTELLQSAIEYLRRTT